MKIVETTFERLPRERLEIGFKGENLRATVRIDCASVFAEYPNATPTLIVKPLFADAYPVVVDRNGTDVDWLITSEILSFSGDGEIQLVFYKDEVICKSAVSKIRVCRSLQVTGTMPDPVAQWIDDANRKLAEVDAQIVELEGMVDTATDAATRAEQSASTASTKAEQAAGSATTATEKATEATNAAGTATAKAAEAALSATQANNSAVSAADSERGAMAKAEQAAGSALSASTDATLATEAAQTATEKAGDASASARAAHASEINAAESADDALSAKTAAEASETAASASATQAAQSVQDAGANAQTAMQKAAEASQSATNAAASATNAATSAETASTKAGEAAASAQAASDAKTAVEETAEQLADSLEQIEQNTQDIADHEQYAEATYAKKTDLYKKADIIHNTASGAIASFPDGAEMPVDEVTAQINPVQDLHGYENPWPGGGTKNKMPNAIPKTETINGITFKLDDFGVFTVTGTATSEASCDFPIGFSFVIQDGDPRPKLALNNTQGTSALFKFFNNSNQVDSWGITPANRVQEYSSMRGKTCDSYRITVPSGATVNVTLSPMIIENSVTDYTYIPYSNICPITGFDGLTVQRTGKNLCQGFERYNVTNYVSSPVFLKAGEQYTVSFESDTTPSAIYLRKGAFNTDAEQYKYNSRQWTFAPNESRMYLFQFYKGETGWNDHTFSDVQLERGSTATEYETPNVQTYDIEFPTEAGTVYSGTLTIAEDESGVLTVDRGMADMGSLVWNYNTTYAFFTSSSISTRKIGVLNVWSDMFKTMGVSWSGTPVQNALWGNGSNTTLYVQIPPLDITYSLSASEIRTLLGENNLWHDANGDISVGYKADTKLYIDNKIAELVARIVNS